MRASRFAVVAGCALAVSCAGDEFRSTGAGGTSGSSGSSGASGAGATAGAAGSGGSAGSSGASGAGATAGAAGSGGSAGSSGGTGGAGGNAPVCRGLEFDGVDDWVHVPDHSGLDKLPIMTVEAWFYAEPYPSKVQIVSHHDHNAHTGYVLLVFSNGNAQFRYQFGGDNHPVGYDPVPAQQWHHVAATWQNDTGTLFIDGTLVTSSTHASGTVEDAARPLALGRAAYEDNFHFKGIIDQVRISKVVRYTTSFTPTKKPLTLDADTVALWTLDEASGQVVNDATGKHHGTLGADNKEADDDPKRVDVPCPADMRLGGS